MTLAAYRKQQGLSLRQLAAQLGVTHATVDQIESSALHPGISLARRIEKLTEGAVPARCPKCGQRVGPRAARRHRHTPGQDGAPDRRPRP